MAQALRRGPAHPGATVRIDAAPCTIVGVLPDGFAFPFPDIDLWMPFQPATLPAQVRLNSPFLSIFGRLKPGISLEQATAEFGVINQRYVHDHPAMLDAKSNRPEPVIRFQEQLVRNIRPTLWMLFGAVGFLLLIACANVASLLLARGASRSREFATRAALGASRRRMVRQLLAEGLLLAVVGGGAGAAVANLGLRTLSLLPGLDLPRMHEIKIDGAVLGFVVVLVLLTTLLFGLAPALSASATDLSGAMRSGSERAGSSGRLALWRSGRGLLVSGQIALSVVLLIGAALMVQTLLRLRTVDPGFHAGHLLTMQIALPQARYQTATQASRFFERVVERVESVPGVRSAAVTLTLPMTGWAGTPVHIVGRPAPKLNERPIAILQSVTPGYFRTMGIALRRGRDFTRRDSADEPLVVIINEALARRFWPAYPAGARIRSAAICWRARIKPRFRSSALPPMFASPA